MKAGFVVLAKIQQADGRIKLRPVVVLGKMPPYSDVLVCAISSKLHHEVKGFDDVIDVNADDFKHSHPIEHSLSRVLHNCCV